MYKIAISGKANSGKNTLSRLLSKELKMKICEKYNTNKYYIHTTYVAFADPIKEMIMLMYPNLPRKYLYGSSKYRNEIIPGSFKNGNPLTVRQLLMDLGTGVGRSYNDRIWLDAFDTTLAKAEKVSGKYDSIIVTDVRFKNEFDHLKKNSFTQIRLLRDSHSKINHSSENNQDDIKDNEFDFIINNNGTLKDLKYEVLKVIDKII